MMIYLIAAVLFGLAPAAIAHSKGGNFFLWWAYGAAIWIVAFPHALLMTPKHTSLEKKALDAGAKKCPDCAELIRQEAVVCRHCGLKLPVGAEISTNGDLQPVENVSTGVEAKPAASVQPSPTAEDNAERIVLGLVSAFLLVLVALGLVALIPRMNEDRVRHRAIVANNIAPTPTPLAPPQRLAARIETERSNAATSANSPECKEVSKHGFVRFLVCDANARPGDWRRAGVEACRGRRVCNVWMWDKVDKAGTSLPMTDAEVNSAVALWVQARHELMDCRQTGC